MSVERSSFTRSVDEIGRDGNVGVRCVHTRTEKKTMAKRIPAAKASRLSIRIDKERKAVISRAAKLHGHTISDFVPENVLQVATELLADEGTITFTKKQVAYIFAALENPSEANVAAVRSLLNERSVLDD